MKMVKKSLAWLLTIVLVLGLATMSVSADDTSDVVKHAPGISETDNGANHWWVGTNVDVELLDNGGFSLQSIDGTIINANIAWDFTYGQLKQTPYLNVTVGNQERVSESPYMKIYFLVGTQVVTVKPFEDKFLEHWVKSGQVRGANCVNLLETIDAAVPGLTDDTQLFMFMYQDPTSASADPMGPLIINELFLSDKKIETTTTTTTTTVPTTVPTSAEGGDVADDAVAETDGMPVGIIIAIVAAVVVALGVVVVIVIKKKK